MYVYGYYLQCNSGYAMTIFLVFIHVFITGLVIEREKLSVYGSPVGLVVEPRLN